MKHPGHQHAKSGLAAIQAGGVIGSGSFVASTVASKARIHDQHPVAMVLEPPGCCHTHQTSPHHDHVGGGVEGALAILCGSLQPRFGLGP